MATKFRLQRHGKKGKAFYHLVIADSRTKRDGRFIEKVGTYNPNTNPATINVDVDRCVHWLQVGAEPTNTAGRILSYSGALIKKHLLGGVKKGAFTEQEAEKRFEEWKSQKESKVQSKIDMLEGAAKTKVQDTFNFEKKQKEDRLKKISEKNTPPPAEEAEEAKEEVAAEAAPEEVSETKTEKAEAKPTEETKE